MPNLVITFSPKEFGRLKELKQNPVEEIAKENNIEIIYFDNFEEQELRDTLKSKKVDVGIVASFGKIIPKTILRVFSFGLINIHPSLLPKYRGSTPIQSAIIEGDITTGTTIFIIDEEMDHGPIIGQISTEISIEDTYKTLEEKLALLGSKLIINLLPNYLNREIAIKPQEEDLATYTKKFFFKACHLV
ncbi:MAG: methionyl-tRNA formyltransferase [Candidatus Pacebacteria bacterium]|nr:methionyl-tRNA formyltransferase [Candidatus Paceibacterota bacterium]